ncbi:MAG: exosortase/archaeosortase family protein [Acidobacteria bacterium]|nr:exosortase/archaeosortase family protein [Acidobacteriota bacterium]
MNPTLQKASTENTRTAALPWNLPGLTWVFALLILCYAPILLALVNQWATDEDMGHGFFVPLVAGYIGWKKREELAAAPLRQNRLGAVLMALAACQSIVGTLGAELFLSRTAFVFSLIGCVLYAGGMPAIRVMAFPLALLFFMVPIPAILYNQITFPLQMIASRVAEVTLSLAGVPVLRDGNILELPSQRLSVVEACSGIRSLLSLSFLSLIYGYFFDGKPWMRWVLLASTVPIAITANASRVTLTGILSEIDLDYSRGVYHNLSGWVVFLVALGMLMIFHYLFNSVYRQVKERVGK